MEDWSGGIFVRGTVVNAGIEGIGTTRCLRRVRFGIHIKLGRVA